VITVLSALYGDYDPVASPPEQTVDVRWVFVTDKPRDLPGWEVIVEPRPELGNRMAAKVPKCYPHFYVNTSRVVWLDAACRITAPDSIERLVDHVCGDQPIAQFAHPYRSCVYEELEASRPVWKYGHQNIDAQVRYYRERGHPRDWGLWATGVIVYYKMTPRFGYRWLVEQMRWSDQDQLSEAPVLRELGIRPRTITGNIFDNDVLGWDYGHRTW
jgi:hypothetical protein